MYLSIMILLSIDISKAVANRESAHTHQVFTGLFWIAFLKMRFSKNTCTPDGKSTDSFDFQSVALVYGIWCRRPSKTHDFLKIPSFLAIRFSKT